MHLEALHRPCNVEHVHGVDNDGGRGEEEEEDEEADVEQDKSHPPRCTTDGQVLPTRKKAHGGWGAQGRQQCPLTTRIVRDPTSD